ncbi:MAG TPA: TerB family tellurite resistance protein [Cyclobacteriaceae bacterium]|jgi:uncharacterized tellurite resistance protein B-like protein|nr:TerB family tellurite resistance protein [Cyclobacteriaceae bacterium]
MDMDMPSKGRSDLYASVTCLFYYLITYSDERVDQIEVSLKDKIAAIEKFNMSHFEQQFLIYNQNDRATVFNKCITDLKELEHFEQIQILAWMFVVADSDDDFNGKEWSVIQDALNILDLSLSQILITERNLNKLLMRKY